MKENFLDFKGKLPNIKDLNEFEELNSCNSYEIEILNDLLRALRRKKGFGLFFVQCDPAQGQQVLSAIKEKLPQKRLVRLQLGRESKTLYSDLLNLYQSKKFDIACITGVEQAMYDYEDTKRLAGWTSEEIYNYSWKGLPPLLNHLNRQREAFECNLPIALIFLIPSFVVDYFVQRAPDFFDWRSGFFKMPTNADPNLLSGNIEDQAISKTYDNLTYPQKLERIFQIKDLIKNASLDQVEKVELLCEQSKLLRNCHNLEQALSCTDLALSIKPDSLNACLEKAINLREMQNYKKSISFYNKAIDIRESADEAWHGMGKALEALGQNTNALSSYDKAVHLKENSHIYWLDLGNLLRKMGRHDEAIRSFEEAIKIDPDDYRAWDLKALSLDAEGHRSEALTCYEKSLELNPANYESWQDRGVALSRLGRHEQALESFYRALSENEKASSTVSYRIIRDIMIELRKLKRYDEAEEVSKIFYEPLLEEIEPHDANGWEAKSIALYKIGKPEEAFQCYLRAYETQADNFNSLNNKGFLSMAKYSYGSNPVFDKPLLIRWCDHQIGSSYFDKPSLEHSNIALLFFNKALEKGRNCVLVWANKCFPEYHLKQYQAAIQSCNQALALDSENKEGMNDVIYSNLGCIFLRLREPQKSLGFFNSAIGLDSQLDEVWIGKGAALYQLKHYEEAIDSFTKALNLNHPLAQAHLDLVRRHLR